ncbi:hypothetical protein CZ814_01913 [Photobacterium toruni]|uniref:Aminotransferase class V domain-containing protein n=1 Tax=Photobacterium toruni TaxID=1935446 RepID=A0A1T4T2D7_9GAMM|nr:hypothetical protein CZ814_01913 [Photobacterium toruni]
MTTARHAAQKFVNAPSADIATALGKQNICIWHGHFHAQGLCEQLNLMKYGGVIRIGCMHYNTYNEIDTLFDGLNCYLTSN